MSATCLSLNEATSRCMVPITPITVPSRTNGVEICELYPKSRADCSVIGGASGLPTMGAICSVRPASIALPTWVRASSGTGRRSASFSKPGSPLSPDLDQAVAQQADEGKAGAEQAQQIAHYRLEHRLGVGGRAADRGQDFTGRGLLLQCLLGLL